MANTLLKNLQNAQRPQQNNTVQNPLLLLGQLKSDPTSFLQKNGFSVPNGMNDPQQIINHLLQSGQVNSTRLNQAQQLMQMFKR